MRKSKNELFATVAVLALTAGLVQTAMAQSAFDAEAFFKGKTIEVVINADAGGGLDTTTRFLLEGLSEFIPGNPRIAPVNIAEIPGISAVYDAPATEGTITIGVTSRVATLYTTTLDAAATHKPGEFQIAGGYGSNPQWMVVFNDGADSFNSIADAIGADGPELVTSGRVGDASQLLDLPLVSSWMCDAFDLPCRMISVANADMADWIVDIERGQINMVNSTSNALVRLAADKLISGEAKVLVEYAEDGASQLDTPYARPDIRELFPDQETADEFENLLPLIAAGGVGNAIFVGPQVPAEAVDAIAAAFVEKASTPENLVQYERGRFGEFPEHKLTPTVLGREDAQRIYEAGMERFLSSQDFYKELQQELYAKYWQ